MEVNKELISFYCYEDCKIFSYTNGLVEIFEGLKEEREYILGSSDGDSWLSAAFFNLDISMKDFIIISTYGAKLWLIGNINNPKIYKSMYHANFNYCMKCDNHGNDILVATSDGYIYKFDYKKLKSEKNYLEYVSDNSIFNNLNEENGFIYPEFIIQYKGESGPFFQKNEIYVCWKSQDTNIKGIAKLGDTDFYLKKPFEAMAFLNNILFAITHNEEETKLHIYNVEQDIEIGTCLLGTENTNIFPYPSLYSNGKLVLVEFNNKYMVFSKENFDNNKIIFNGKELEYIPECEYIVSNSRIIIDDDKIIELNLKI